MVAFDACVTLIDSFAWEVGRNDNSGQWERFRFECAGFEDDDTGTCCNEFAHPADRDDFRGLLTRAEFNF